MSDVPTIHQALAAVMAEVRSVEKSDTNTHQKFKFRGVDAVVNAVGPALRKHGVIVVPHVLSNVQGTVEVGQNRTRMGHVQVHVQYTFYGPTGDSIPCSVIAESMDAGDKATPKAMSVAYRTALLQALCLPTDDPDPDSHNYERSAAVPVPQQRQPAADAATVRAQIGRWCSVNGYLPEDAEARFRAEHDGREIFHEEDPTVLNAFFARWQQDHQAVTA